MKKIELRTKFSIDKMLKIGYNILSEKYENQSTFKAALRGRQGMDVFVPSV